MAERQPRYTPEDIRRIYRGLEPATPRRVPMLDEMDQSMIFGFIVERSIVDESEGEHPIMKRIRSELTQSLDFTPED